MRVPHLYMYICSCPVILISYDTNIHRYTIFLSEKRECVKEEHGASSMSAVSKVMGQMWSQLSGEEKALYYSLAESDRQRYITEMRTYFAELYKGNHTRACGDVVHLLIFIHAGMSDVDLEEIDSVLTASSVLESNDQALHCQICQISFTSLNNKRSHFSGRLHRQSLIEHLHSKLASSTNTAQSLINTSLANVVGPANTDHVGFQGEKSCDECFDLIEQIRDVAMHRKGNLQQ